MDHTPPEQTRRLLELSTMEDGSVTISGVTLAAERSAPFHLVARKPAAILAAVEAWLDEHEEGAITIVVRNPAVAVATWTTRSTSMAMYWLAAILGKAWAPSFKLHESSAPDAGAAGVRATQQESGPIVVSGGAKVA